MRHVGLASLASLALLAGRVAIAQTAQTGAVVGVVTDAATLAPVPDVELRVVGTTLGARTDAAGRFRVAAVPRGTRTLVVRRLGYVGDSTEVDVGADSTVVEFTLMASVARLPTTRVEDRRTEERPVKFTLEEFEQRRKAGNGGWYISNEVLTKKSDNLLSDVMRSAIPTLDLQRAPDGTLYAANRRVQTRTVGMKNAPCVPRVFVNGLAIGDSTVSTYTAGEFAGVEYHDGATVPVQYRRTGTECGVILLWRR